MGEFDIDAVISTQVIVGCEALESADHAVALALKDPNRAQWVMFHADPDTAISIGETLIKRAQAIKNGDVHE